MALRRHADQPYADMLGELDANCCDREPGFADRSSRDLVLPSPCTVDRARGGESGWVDGGVSVDTIERCAEAGADPVADHRTAPDPIPTPWSSRCASGDRRLHIDQQLVAVSAAGGAVGLMRPPTASAWSGDGCFDAMRVLGGSPTGWNLTTT